MTFDIKLVSITNSYYSIDPVVHILATHDGIPCGDQIFFRALSVSHCPELYLEENGKMVVASEGYRKQCGFSTRQWSPSGLTCFNYETELVNDFESPSVRNSFEPGCGIWFVVE